ncbi:unnamed protein product [Peronospora belbahrii]|uniref:DRBM domain-containing protein n=1 Tax=Peronospora belbahrii TaxID=622444 RepID=A0ABN8CUQ5_9STRA|nr:unnamed protein product [Peronospora belbahrii]
MEEMTRLREVLSASDKQTKDFLQPLLSLRGVQDLLLTFIRDSSRSFEDWVWDPQVRQTLLNIRAMEPQVYACRHDVDQVYTRVAEERMATRTQQFLCDDTPSDLLARVNAAQNDGKIKFQKKNYYAAKNAFLKALEALLEHQRSEYYGKTIPVIEWDEMALQMRYVTLCNNIAICGMKLKDYSLINEYTFKALSVDQASTKALYALIKLRAMEHRYTEAKEIVEKALTMYPENAQYLHLKKEIKATEWKEALQQAELAEIRAKQLQTAMAMPKKATLTEEEQELQWKLEMQKRIDETPLPTKEDDTFAASRLNDYFTKTKQRLMVDIRTCHNSNAGEEALFECAIVNGTTGEVLAANVQGASKKFVKNEACKIVIEKLWNDKQAADKLIPEDMAYLERFERAKASGHPLVKEATVPAKIKQTLKSSSQLPTRVSWLERQLPPLSLLNQLTQRGTLQARFDIEDVSPNKGVTEFKCVGYLDGDYVATANAISKKKARTEVAQRMLAAAYEKNLLMVYDGSTDEDENGAHDEKNLDGSEHATAD